MTAPPAPVPAALDRDELLPCPFCGSPGRLIAASKAGYLGGYVVDCVHTACGGLGPQRNATGDAIAAWSRRAPLTTEQSWRRSLNVAVNASCSCGGGEPGRCCEACEVWHRMEGREIPARRGVDATFTQAHPQRDPMVRFIETFDELAAQIEAGDALAVSTDSDPGDEADDAAPSDALTAATGDTRC